MSADGSVNSTSKTTKENLNLKKPFRNA